MEKDINATLSDSSDIKDSNIAIIERIQSGDNDAYQELINANEGFVRYIARRYYSTVCELNSIDMDDILQAGRIGIYKAVKKYNPQRGIKFISHAAYYLRNEMRMVIGIRSSKRNPADYALSLDQPMDNGNGSILSDIIPAVEHLEWLEAERASSEVQWNALYAALGRMKNQDIRGALVAYFWIDKSGGQIAKDYGVKSNEIYRRIRKGLSLLRNDSTIKKLAIDYGIKIVH